MAEYYIKNLDPDELAYYYTHIKRDFIRGEYAPYPVLYRQLREGIQEGLLFCEGKLAKAYSICAAGCPNGYVLISLMAVLKEFRGYGTGSAFIESIGHRYGDRQAVIAEVECPELAESEEERKIRIRRIAFYEKAGFYLIPDIEYLIWDNPFHLMALPLKASKTDINEGIVDALYEVYRRLMGDDLMHKFKLKRL